MTFNGFHAFVALAMLGLLCMGVYFVAALRTPEDDYLTRAEARREARKF